MDKFKHKMISNWLGLLGIGLRPELVSCALDNGEIAGVKPMAYVQTYKLHEVYKEIQTKYASGLNIMFIGKVWELVRIPEKESGYDGRKYSELISCLTDYAKENPDNEHMAITALLHIVQENVFGNYSYVMASIIANEFLRWDRKYIEIDLDKHLSLFDELRPVTFDLCAHKLLKEIEVIEDIPCGILPGGLSST